MIVNETPASLFPDYTKENRKRFFDLLSGLEEFRWYMSQYQYRAFAFCIIINIPHITILSRKEMRKSSVNVIMIGLAVCEIITYFNAYREALMAEINNNITCKNAPTRFDATAKLILEIIRDFFRQSSIILCVLLAAIRTLFVKNALNSKYDALSSSKLGWYIILITFIISFIGSSSYWFVTDPTVRVYNFPKHKTCKKVLIHDYYLNEWYHTYTIAFGVFYYIIPGILSPILTLMLALDLRKARNERNKVTNLKESGKKNHTTSLITYISASFMVTAIPQGLLFVVGAFDLNSGESILLIELKYVFEGVEIFNCATRAFICYAMSSQYRDTLKSYFRHEIEEISNNAGRVHRS